MIRLEGISHDFKPRRILSDINIDIKPREVYGLVGNTGSGKSTLLRIMNGFIEATKGQVYLMGEKLTKESRGKLVKRTSMIFQHFNLLSNLNVLENVLLPNKLRKMDKEKSVDKARHFLKFVGLQDYENAYIKTLSGGQKQRVAIARTLMSEPEIIFCDEPTSALDGEMRQEVLKLLRDINEQMGTTIVIVSHDISVIQAMCHRAAILEDGQIRDVVTLERQPIKTLSYQEALKHV